MKNTRTLSDILQKYRQDLCSYYSGNEINSIFSLIAGHLLNYSKIDIHLNADQPIFQDFENQFDQILIRLKRWEPVQYILGHTEFYGLPFHVDENVLIPRQETELLVKWIIDNEKGRSGNIIDMGTGSGCIAVTLAKNLPQFHVAACDIQNAALKVAKSNAGINGVSIDFFYFNILDNRLALPQKFDIMVSNPPYVTHAEKHFIQHNVLDFEPETALFVPDSDPLVFYRNIGLLGRKYIKDGGSLYLEINEMYPRKVMSLLTDAGFYAVEVKDDLNGKKRMVRGRK